MSKYDSLWEYIERSKIQCLKLTFEEIKDITGFEIDHSFLKYKKDLIKYGFKVDKISMKEQSVIFKIII